MSFLHFHHKAHSLQPSSRRFPLVLKTPTRTAISVILKQTSAAVLQLPLNRISQSVLRISSFLQILQQCNSSTALETTASNPRSLSDSALHLFKIVSSLFISVLEERRAKAESANNQIPSQDFVNVRRKLPQPPPSRLQLATQPTSSKSTSPSAFRNLSARSGLFILIFELLHRIAIASVLPLRVVFLQTATSLASVSLALRKLKFL